MTASYLSQRQIETWRDVPGYPAYEVSDAGRVRSTKYGLRPRILRTPLSDGYPRVTLRDATRTETHYWKVHQLVMLAFVGPRPDGMDIRHLDGDRTNNRLTNLAYGSHAENMADMVRHGTSRQIAKTHCPQGHPYSGDNLRLYRNHRYCRTCQAAHSAARYAAKRDRTGAVL